MWEDALMLELKLLELDHPNHESMVFLSMIGTVTWAIAITAVRTVIKNT